MRHATTLGAPQIDARHRVLSSSSSAEHLEKDAESRPISKSPNVTPCLGPFTPSANFSTYRRVTVPPRTTPSSLLARHQLTASAHTVRCTVLRCNIRGTGVLSETEDGVKSYLPTRLTWTELEYCTLLHYTLARLLACFPCSQYWENSAAMESRTWNCDDCVTLV